MSIARIFVFAFLAVAPAACFTADQPLLNDGNSVAPFERIAFRSADDDEVNTLVRQGSAYVATSEDETLGVRFMPLDRPDLYVVEVSGPGDDGKTIYLYAVLKVDTAAGTADVFRAVGDATDAGPGLRVCEDDFICIDDLAAFAAYGKVAVDAGDEPQMTYRFTTE